MEDLERRVGSLEGEVGKLRDALSVLKTDVAEMKATLSSLATKADLSQMLNGLLRDALYTVPAKHTIIWSMVSAIAAAASVGIAILLRH